MTALITDAYSVQGKASQVYQRASISKDKADLTAGLKAAAEEII